MNLKINNKLKILVAEPWDFTSSDGENILISTVIDINKNVKNKPLYLAINNSVFERENMVIKYVIFFARNKFNDINMYKINENEIEDFQNMHLDINKYVNSSNFILIGTIEEIED